MKLYLDMDGVLADFDAKKKEIFGYHKVPDNIMWYVINKYFPEYFFELPEMQDLTELWKYCKPLNPTILTAIPLDNKNRIDLQKRRWLDMHLDAQVPMIWCRRKEKQNYAMSGVGPNVLIDDNLQNIEEWQAKGGIGIYHQSAKKSIAKFKYLTGELVS